LTFKCKQSRNITLYASILNFMGEKMTFGTAAASEPWFGVRKPMKGNDQLHILRHRLYWYKCCLKIPIFYLVTTSLTFNFVATSLVGSNFSRD